MRYDDKFNQFQKLSKEQSAEAKYYLNLMRLAGGFSKDLVQTNRDNAQDALAKSQEYLDSMNFYDEKAVYIDSLLKHKQYDVIYKVRYYLKATTTSGDKKMNFSDTIFRMFDQNLNLVPAE